MQIKQALILTSCCLTTQDSEDFPSIQSKTNLFISPCWDYSGTLIAYISLCLISNKINENVNFLVFYSWLTLCVSCQASAAGSLSPRRSLYRTLSDESVCSNRKGSSYASSRSSVLDQALPNDILFSSTPPYHSTLPPRISQPTSNLKSESIYLSNLSIRPSGCSFNQSFYRFIYPSVVSVQRLHGFCFVQ